MRAGRPNVVFSRFGHVRKIPGVARSSPAAHRQVATSAKNEGTLGAITGTSGLTAEPDCSRRPRRHHEKGPHLAGDALEHVRDLLHRLRFAEEVTLNLS